MNHAEVSTQDCMKETGKCLGSYSTRPDDSNESRSNRVKKLIAQALIEEVGDETDLNANYSSYLEDISGSKFAGGLDSGSSDIYHSLPHQYYQSINAENSNVKLSRQSLLNPWTVAEDEVLLALQADLGNDWAKIAKSLPGRGRVDSKVRFVAIKRAKRKLWTREEDDKILKLFKQLKGNWKEISTKFSNRTKNAVMFRHRELRYLINEGIEINPPALGSSVQIYYQRNHAHFRRCDVEGSTFTNQIGKLCGNNQILNMNKYTVVSDETPVSVGIGVSNPLACDILTNMSIMNHQHRNDAYMFPANLNQLRFRPSISTTDHAQHILISHPVTQQSLTSQFPNQHMVISSITNTNYA